MKPRLLPPVAPDSAQSGAPAGLDPTPLPPAPQRHKARRNGRIARLPKLQRDIVNRMISNGFHYKNTVAALDELRQATAGHVSDCGRLL